ncbi:unnamed protein product [Musa acuminata var. zebrina]
MQDEYLTSVSGYVKYDCSEFPCVSQLTFTTNLGKTYGPYGGGGGTFFEVNVEYDEIKGFFGQATTEYLTAFGVYHTIKSTFIIKNIIIYYLIIKYKITLIYIQYSDYKIDIWFDTSLSIIEFQLRIHNKYFFFIRFFYVILKTLCLIKIFNLIIYILKTTYCVCSIRSLATIPTSCGNSSILRDAGLANPCRGCLISISMCATLAMKLLIFEYIVIQNKNPITLASLFIMAHKG